MDDASQDDCTDVSNPKDDHTIVQIPVEGPDTSTTTFFQASRNVTIAGGHFNSTMGHHTNLTINLNQPPSLVLDATPNVAQGSVHSDTLSSVRRGDHLGNGGSDSHSQIASTAKVAVQSFDMPLQTLKSNEIYERHLCLKKRGFPLWIPEPNRRLPIEYRRLGISVGDVGIITPFGGFSFLFNICLPADDPINLGRVPEGFSPISPPLDPSIDVSEFSEFKQGSYLASSSIKKSRNNDSSIPDLSFETTASEGAILTMPEGAISFDLENVPRFRAYAAANVESWYRFANGPRGREAKNGDIRLVTGCDKTNSWGMASLANVSQEQNNSLRFKALEIPHGSSSTCAYTWDCSGMAEARVGPDFDEINYLRSSESSSAADSDSSGAQKYINQCLFVRTLNITLGHEMWEKLTQELKLKYGTNEGDCNRSANEQGGILPASITTSTATDEKGSSSELSESGPYKRLSLSNSADEDVMNVLQYYGNAGVFRFEHLSDTHSEISNLKNRSDTDIQIDNCSSKLNTSTRTLNTPSQSLDGLARKIDDISASGNNSSQMLITTTPESSTFHPSNYLNKFILQKHPEARLVITHDDDWISAVSERDEPVLESLEEHLSNRIVKTHGVLYEWNGSISLILNRESLTSEVRERPSSEYPGPVKKKKFAPPACERCFRSKMKCDGGIPCVQCKKRGHLDCTKAIPTRQKAQTKPSSVACGPCRARKIRCDIARPRCSNCTRRAINCTYSVQDSKVVESKVDADAQSRCPTTQPAGTVSNSRLPSPALA